jgi:hypothetical protein
VIKKILVCNRHDIYLQSRPLDYSSELGKAIELLIPLRTFWDIEKMIEAFVYLVSTGEDKVGIEQSYKSILKACGPFAIKEVDRQWLHEKSKN